MENSTSAGFTIFGQCRLFLVIPHLWDFIDRLAELLCMIGAQPLFQYIVAELAEKGTLLAGFHTILPIDAVLLLDEVAIGKAERYVELHVGRLAVAGDQWIMNDEVCFREKVDKTVDGGGLSLHDSMIRSRCIQNRTLFMQNDLSSDGYSL